MEEGGQPTVGDLGGEFDVLRAERGEIDRDVLAHRMVDQLQGLAEPRALIFRKRELVVRAVMHHDLSSPDRTTDLHNLALTAEGLVVLHAMEPLDDLRAGRTEAEDEAPARDCVEPGGGHGDRAGGAAVDVEDARTELHGVGLRSEVTQDRHGVEAVEFRHPADIDAGLLQISGFGGGQPRVAGVREHHRQLHGAERMRDTARRETGSRDAKTSTLAA